MREVRLVKGLSCPSVFAGGLLMALCLAVALYLLIFPLQDFDTFWHLAYGRAMVESGSFINHEIFSYTAPGKYLGSHSQLAQVILYALWAAGGASALLGFKLLVAAMVFALLVATVRLFGARMVAGSALALAAVTVGVGRFVERPELFSILLQALLIWLLFRARKRGYSGWELWAIPPLMVAWDYLHGAVYGLVVLLTFVGAEVVRVKLLPALRWRWGAGEAGSEGVNRLLLWSGLTLLVMALHPNGLSAYEGFWRVGSSSEFRMYGEFMAPTGLQFLPYWLFLGMATLLLGWRWRRCDLTALLLALPFLYLSLTYNRAVLAFCLTAIPALSQTLAPLCNDRVGSFRGRAAAALGVLLLLGGVLLYKQFYIVEAFRFGTGVSGNVFPVGSVRFVKERNLSGNMYNMNAFGGYLAYFLAPERRIFHYNQPGVFTALFDYLHKPASRREWPIDYAIVGEALEFNMFNREGYVTVYQEPTAAVLVRNDERHAELIRRYRVSSFGPLKTDEELLARARLPLKGERLLQEMSDYLAFREDKRIASLFARLLRESPGVASDADKTALLEPALLYNQESAPLLGLKAELFYRQGDFAAAGKLFEQALTLSPEDYPARLGLGYLDYDQGHFESAAAHFARLAAAYPQAADAHYALGLANLKLCRKDQARHSFEQFLLLAPQSRYAPKAQEFLRSLEQICR